MFSEVQTGTGTLYEDVHVNFNISIAIDLSIDNVSNYVSMFRTNHNFAISIEICLNLMKAHKKWFYCQSKSFNLRFLQRSLL